MSRALVSDMANGLVGSEIIKLAGEINDKIAQGEKITNLTIGDFNPSLFPIPDLLKEEIIKAYQNNQTNYPVANGLLELRQSVVDFVQRKEKLNYGANDVQIACGARPLIYATYQAIVNPDEKVLFPVPSWNNNHYCHLSSAQKIQLDTTPENNFMPTAEEIAPHLSEVTMIALCSPLNPTGTIFPEEQLKNICELVLTENERREKNNLKPLYILYDQIYSLLIFDKKSHYSPVQLFPALKNYTIYIDGISKAFAATGVRVGWAYGPSVVMQKMKAILGHVGAWSPRAEQTATASFLNNSNAVDGYLKDINDKISTRLQLLYKGFSKLKDKGYAIEAIEPQAAIYLTVGFHLVGKKMENGETIETPQQITQFLLNEAKIGIVPFYSFGTDRSSTWFRISVGTLAIENIEPMFAAIEKGLAKLS